MLVTINQTPKESHHISTIKYVTRYDEKPSDNSFFTPQTTFFIMFSFLVQRISLDITFLYFPTKAGHFYQLMRDLRPFLKDENLLFAEDEKGNTVGFLFWHPDFNQMLNGGKHYSTLGIAAAYLLRSKKIENAKLNAMGTLSPRVTSELLNELSRVMGDRYKTLETNFVWDNNLPSTHVNRRFFGEPHRKYEVYFYEVD